MHETASIRECVSRWHNTYLHLGGSGSKKYTKNLLACLRAHVRCSIIQRASDSLRSDRGPASPSSAVRCLAVPLFHMKALITPFFFFLFFFKNQLCIKTSCTPMRSRTQHASEGTCDRRIPHGASEGTIIQWFKTVCVCRRDFRLCPSRFQFDFRSSKPPPQAENTPSYLPSKTSHLRSIQLPQITFSRFAPFFPLLFIPFLTSICTNW